VIDGCPAGLELDEDVIRADLARRRPGRGGASTTRSEPDAPEILSGVFEGRTLGTPIAIIIRNTSHISSDYNSLRDVWRPGHADFGYDAKYGFRDHRGGGRASARETAARVAAGAVARALLAKEGVSIRGWTEEAAGIRAPGPGEAGFDIEEAERNSLRLPSRECAEKALSKIEEVRANADSAGGVVRCQADGLRPGLGEPVFAKLDAALAGAIMSIGAVKGVEIGEGFAAARLRGSENNDAFAAGGAFLSSHSGGVLGGLSTGQTLDIRAAFKPVPSIAKEQRTSGPDGKERVIRIAGRHDVCVCPRAVPVVEAMTALVLADFLLRARTDRV